MCLHCNGGLVCGKHSIPVCFDCELEGDKGWATMRYCPRFCAAAMRVSEIVGQRKTEWSKLVYERIKLSNKE